MLRRKKRRIIVTITISILISIVVTAFLLIRVNHEKKIEKLKVADFNQIFLEYDRKNLSLESIKKIINDIIQSNADNPEQQITVKIVSQGVEKETMDSAILVNTLATLEAYEYDFSLYFEYNENGYIRMITINQDIPEEDIKILEFNKRFTQYNGNNISATLVKSLLTAISENNNMNKQQQITVEISDSSLNNQTMQFTKLEKLQEVILEKNRYKTEFEFDDNGYVSKVYIKKIESIAQNNISEYQNKTITGKEFREDLINNIILYNSENSEYKIKLYSKGLKSISEIKDEEYYEITILYNLEGYPERIDALKK